jgi:cyclopropane fatty-acyl-phospholipid synthase-like methyltransferase
VDYARRWIAREGVDCQIELSDWQDLHGAGRFDAIMTDEVIVHFFHLDAFFRKAFELLRDGGILVNKELHFAHPAYARQPDAAMRFIGTLYGGVGSYRTLAEELQLANQAGFRVEDIRQIQPINYYLTASAWHANLRRCESEIVDLVGAETYANYLKYLVYVMLSPGGKTTDPLPLFTHFVRCRKAPRHIREKLAG